MKREEGGKLGGEREERMEIRRGKGRRQVWRSKGEREEREER